MNEQEREAILREIAKKRAVLKIAGMETLPVRRGIEYRDGLLMDIYQPSLVEGQRAPVVVMPLGYPDPQNGVRGFGPFTSWAQLIAASGMAAVVYGNRSPVEDGEALAAYLRAHADELQIDASRMGIYSGSGNGPTALSLLMRDRGIACVALNCPFTMDVPGSTAFAEASRQYGFVDACAGKTAADLPEGVPMLFLRAGREWFPGLNEAMDRVVAGAVARNLPVTFVNHATGAHGFDLDEDTAISRGIIGDVLAYLGRHLLESP